MSLRQRCELTAAAAESVNEYRVCSYEWNSNTQAVMCFLWLNLKCLSALLIRALGREYVSVSYVGHRQSEYEGL